MRRYIGLIFAAVLLWTSALPVSAQTNLIPVGRIVGLKLRDNQVTVAAYDDALGEHARGAGLKIGDTILSVNGKDIHRTEDVAGALADGDTAALTVRRGSKTVNLSLKTVQTPEGRKLGVYLRQGIAGIGTVTYFDPASGTFGALGHGVNDSSGCLLQMAEGNAYFAEILTVTRGRCGQPGQLKGSAGEDCICGQLQKNTPQGVFGRSASGWTGTALPAAEENQLHTGPACILSTVSGDCPRQYDVEIVKLYPTARVDGRNLLLKVTDPSLLEVTGGIVQGMSGSPILQDGLLVGAVTHVLVNDPTMGYGIFIGNMLDAAG